VGVVFGILYLVVSLYLLLLFGRLIIGWIGVFARDWRPSGPLVVVLEVIYSATDPPLKLLRRVIPPLTIGSVRLDLGFMILFIACITLRSIFGGLAGLP